MKLIVSIKKMGCQPVDLEEVRARRARRWRLLILILVACGVVALADRGYTVDAALVAIVGVVSAAYVVARYVLGPARIARAVA